MESRVTSLLENILERLTKVETQQETQLKKQSQIDQVIECLDTIQNCLERQNHKQNLLHDKLSAVSVSTQMVEEKVFTKDKLLSDLSIQLKQAQDFTADQLSAISAEMKSEMTNKFSSVYTQLEQEKVFMRDQLKEAQDEILHRLTELQQQNVSTRSQAVSVSEEMKQLQATAGPNPVKETAEFCSQADGDVMDARLAKMSETLEQSVKAVTRAELVWLDNRTQQQISELSDKVGELAEVTLKIVESIKQENKDMATDFQIDVGEEIRAQTEPMMNEVQKFLTETAEKNRVSISQQREDMKTFYTEIVTKVEKTSAELPRTLYEVKKEIKDHIEKVKGEIIADTNTTAVKLNDEYIGTQNQLLQDIKEQTEAKGKESMEKITDKLEKVKEELLRNANSVCLTLKDTLIKSQTETIQNTQAQIEIAVKESTTKVTDVMGIAKKELSWATRSECQRLKEETDSHVEKIQKTQRQIQSKVKESVDKVHTELGKVHTGVDKVHTDLNKMYTYLDKTKSDLVVLVDGQNYKMSRLLQHVGLYTFDFYIENFRQLARSDKTVRSKDCLIKQICTSVHGYVSFYHDDTMRAFLKYSKYHSYLASQLRPGLTLRITVAITDTSGQLPNVLMGQGTHTWKEEDIAKGELCRISIGNTISCAELIKKGYGQNEGYENGALLVRYDIEVL